MKPHHISYILPILSILIVTGFLFFGKPKTTGYAVFEYDNDTRIIDADVSLKTSSHEIIPAESIIKISLDERSASLPIKEFIKKTGKESQLIEGTLEKINYKGDGFTGNYTFALNISDFPINRTIKKGTHTLITEIIYDDVMLFKKEKTIVID